MLNKIKSFSKSVYAKLTLTAVAVFGVTGVAHAGVTTPTSLLNTQAETILKDFGADLMPTALAVIAIIIPVGLALWALGFGIKKGISYLQRRASKSV